MYKEHTVGVVVPAYNEEGHIGDVIRTMPAFVDRIYFVDDASTDNTWEEALSAAREGDSALSPRPENGVTAVSDGGASPLTSRARVHDLEGKLLPIRHRENLGAGGAIKTGYLAARQDGTDITVTMDGDGQMEPQYMPKLLDPIVSGKADYVKANRLVDREYRKDMPRFRFIGNAILTFLTKVASGYWKTMDPQNGYTAASHRALEAINLESMYEYYGYCNDILVKLNAADMRVADVGLPAKYGDEESNIKYPTYIRKVSGMLLRNFLWRLKVKYLVLDFHPLALFYFFGALTAGIGLFGMGWSLYAKISLESSLFTPGLLSLIVFAIGCICLLNAMVYDMQVNEDHEVQIRD